MAEDGVSVKRVRRGLDAKRGMKEKPFKGEGKRPVGLPPN